MKLRIELEVDCDPDDELDDDELETAERAIIEDLKDNKLDTYVGWNTDDGTFQYQFTDVKVERVTTDE